MRWGIVGLLSTVAIALLLASGFGFDTGEKLRVVFFDVGQGDSIYIESPTGIQVLIDGGPDRSVLRALGREMGFWDRSLDIVLATHEDKDHVGGLPDVFMRYDVATFVRTENQGESAEARIIDDLSKQEEAEIVYARRGMVYDLGGGAQLEILFPDRDPSMLESNTSSIVARLVYGESEFLFTGDSPEAIEEYLFILDPETLQSDVLKAGHHGSRTSTGDLFLNAVKPMYAIISSGKENRYGHPHPEVVERLHKAHVQVLNTAADGSIVILSDGTNLYVR